MIQSAALTGINPIQLVQSTAKTTEVSPNDTVQNFSSFLKNAIDSVAGQEENAKIMGDKYMTGKVNMDQVMVASEQALLSLQLTSQVRNKVIEAYQEIMRIQM
ncbi:flagellar hook-basal body complex protein FliE [Paenibacillus shirakamiensis]|uniref:Flagellar hook-basal body complex protein FliE n=1 Tax=Paenibacillus shirakamiensis TaxID=1265935 RepID=A0ABS4JHB8_9BACL|nr:flagellar hook-basal body complex protein FliE [Paenibacillus shirakamiensis]MBP2001123.1 flagellar hook-basal body complex protein FliE [Paenibacillus shirakamiensis]